MAKHLVPSCGPGYDRFFKNVVDYTELMCGGATPQWTHIPQPERTALAAAYEDWLAGYSRTLKPHTKADTEAMKAAYTRSKKVLSRFIKVWFRGFPDIVTAEHLANMDIPPIDNTPTPIPVPDNQVEADLVFPGIHMVELQKIRPVSGTPPDTRSDYGVRIYYGFSGPPSEKFPFRLAQAQIPRRGEDLPYSVFTRKKKMRFDFEGESGCTVYFCLRYENGKGEVGPFGPMLQAVIP
jgi:hypothetical protein